MTEEDIKYRQGRSKKQADDHAKAAMISVIGMIITLLCIFIFG